MRESIRKIVKILSDSDINVVHCGNKAEVEYDERLRPICITLPAIDENTSDEMLVAIQGFIDHELGHVLFTDPQTIVDATNNKIKNLHNIIEDTFIERQMIIKFKGSQNNISNMRCIFTNQFIEEDYKTLNRSSSEQEYWNLLIACCFRAWAGQSHFMDYMADKWTLIPSYVERLESITKFMPYLNSSRECLDMALEVKRLLNEEDLDEKKDYKKSSKGKDSLDGKSSNKNPDSEEDSKKLNHDDSEISDFDDAIRNVIGKLSEKDDEAREYKVFSKDWDVISSEFHESVRTQHVDDFENAVNEHVRRITKKMENIFKAKNKSRFVKGKRQGKINQSSLYRLSNNNDKIFKKKQIKKTNEVAVSLLIDCSGSMRGSKIKLACEVAWAMANVLDRLGIANEVMGFTNGRTPMCTNYDLIKKKLDKIGSTEKQKYSRQSPIYMPVFKSFDERFLNVQKRRLTIAGRSELSMRGNIDGESVLYAAERLLKTKEKSRALIVLSDGMPAVDSCNSSTSNKHLKDSVIKVEKMGIKCIGFGIEDSSVKDFYPKNIEVRKIEDLAEKVMNELKQILFD